MPPKARPNNRLLVLCTSINDRTVWPFWKFLQMKRIKGVTDMAVLAFNSEGGSFEARIDGQKYTMKNFAKVRGYRQEMFQSFLDRWYDPGRSYFVYGGHGMGDYLEFEQQKFTLQAHELAKLLERRKFEAILFDACFMSNLDCAYHLRHNTQYIGACEGYMWEPDTALDYHVFNTFTASAMSRYRDPKLILETVQREYTSKAPRGDFAVLDTTHVAELRQFVQDHVIQRVYNRAMLYSPAQQERLGVLIESALAESIKKFGEPGGDSYLDNLLARRHDLSMQMSPDAYALANSGRLTRKQRVAAAIQFEHALYPSEAPDKHLVDLRSYLLDMAAEEEAGVSVESGVSMRKGRRPLIRKAAAGAWSPSRAACVDDHGSLPPLRVLRTPLSPTKTGEGLAAGELRGGSSAAASPTGAAALQPCDSPASARYGLELFNKVVVSHVPPRSPGIYAARLGGLSLTVHEYSCMSKPLAPWQVSRTILNKRIKMFLAKGSLDEVSMRCEVGAPITEAAGASLGIAPSHSAATVATPPTAAAVVFGSVPAKTAAASVGTAVAAAPARGPGHPARPAGAPAAPGAPSAGTSPAPPSSTPAASSRFGVSVTATNPRLATAASSSSYASLSSRSRGYASDNRPSSGTAAPLSMSCVAPSSPSTPSTRWSRSLHEERESARMAMEAAQLLDSSPPR